MRKSAEPTFWEMLLGLIGLSWIYWALIAYMQINLVGAVSALVTGILYIRIGKLVRGSFELNWLYGWDEEPLQRALIRMPFIAFILFGPSIKYLFVFVTQETPFAQYSNLAPLFGSIPIGLILSLVLNSVKIK